MTNEELAELLRELFAVSKSPEEAFKELFEAGMKRALREMGYNFTGIRNSPYTALRRAKDKARRVRASG